MATRRRQGFTRRFRSKCGNTTPDAAPRKCSQPSLNRNPNLPETPWNCDGSIWKTEAAFIGWIRGQLRKIWKNYPPSNVFKQSKAVKAPAGSRAKWLVRCEICKEMFAKSHIQVDHKIPAGSISWDTMGDFLQRLLAVPSEMRCLCRPCHERVTLAERRGCSLDEAATHKRLIEFKKLSAAEQKQILANMGAQEEHMKTIATRASYFSDTSKPNHPGLD